MICASWQVDKSLNCRTKATTMYSKDYAINIYSKYIKSNLLFFVYFLLKRFAPNKCLRYSPLIDIRLFFIMISNAINTTINTRRSNKLFSIRRIRIESSIGAHHHLIRYDSSAFDFLWFISILIFFKAENVYRLSYDDVYGGDRSTRAGLNQDSAISLRITWDFAAIVKRTMA